MRRALVLGLVPLMLPSCAILSPIFGMEPPRDEVTLYQSAMADYSLCETAPDPSERASAAARLAQATVILSSEQRPTNPDHFFEADRVAAANARCQAALAQ